jgi:hypothetical protein
LICTYIHTYIQETPSYEPTPDPEAEDDSDSKVVNLGDSNFKSEVTDSDADVMLEFYGK